MTRRRSSTLTAVLGLCPLLASTTIDAQERSAKPIDFGPRLGYVNDLAGVVDADSRNTMEDLASEVRRKSKGEIVVITLPSLRGNTPDAVAAELSELWNVGYEGMADDPANKTGVLVILSIEDREFSIQVQDGVKEFFPDAAIRHLVTTKAIKPFRAGDYGTGLLETVRGLAQVFAQRFRFRLESGP